MTQKRNNVIDMSNEPINGKVGSIILMSLSKINTANDDMDGEGEGNNNPPPNNPPDNNPPNNPPNNGNELPIIKFGELEYKTNEYGDLLNEDGSIFKTKSEYEEATKPVVVTINDVDYKIDEQGNAINDDNEIVYTKAQLDALDNPEEPYIEQVIKVVGIPLTDYKGNPIQYEDSPLGISKYISDVSEIKAEEIANELLNERYNTYPVLKQIEEHLILNNGRIDNFDEDIDYSGIQLEETNESQLMNIVIKEKMDKGDTEEDARQIAELFKKEGILFKQAQSSLKYLDTKSKEIVKDRQERIAKMEADMVEEDNKFWTSIQSKVLSERKITIGEESIVIPEVMKRNEGGVIKTVSNRDFFNYMYQPYKYNINGETVIMTRNQYDLRLEEQYKSSADYEVYEALKRFVGYDESQIIIENKNKKVVKDIKDKSNLGNSGRKPISISYKTKKDIDNINTNN